MAEKQESTRSRTISAPSFPTITLPSRSSTDTLFYGGLSPGPMTLVSSFFPDNNSNDNNNPDSDYPSFSLLLAGAMASPIARPSFFSDSCNSVPINDNNNSSSSSIKQDGLLNGCSMGFNSIPHHSPLFTIPPGLSPSGLLNSPGFFPPPPQSPFGMSHQQVLAQVTAQATGASQNHIYLQPQNSMVEFSDRSYSDRKQQPPPAVDKPSDDGYNWRKYGQKPIKGCEYPRSYYKCTHQNCPVKKQVERSSDGQITEIIYKGLHNHKQPQPDKRAKDRSNENESTRHETKPEFSSLAHSRNEREKESARDDPLEPPGSSDSEEVCETKPEEGNEDAPNAKRRQTDVGISEIALPHKTLTEAKIIVQTRSEVDLLDDGYRWRKYGQKVVKGNPHPRSYYKCTSAGCNVRKHVERAASDPKAVVTTYEGKHNHDVPAARNSSHNTANNIEPQLKHPVAEKHPLLQGMDFGNSDQRPVLLQLKEEEITV